MKPNEIIGQFEIFKYKAQETLCEWLTRELPILNAVNWWKSNVIDKLNDEQRRTIQQNNVTTISGLDFAQLLKILDRNWFDFCHNHGFSQEHRSYLTALQAARNRWSHKTTDDIRKDPDGINIRDLNRDIDTIERFMRLFNTTEQDTLEGIRVFMNAIMNPPEPVNPSPPPPSLQPPPLDPIQIEVQKVTRRLPRWANNQHQINAKILTLFLQLEEEWANNITEIILMEKYGNEPEFNINFAQMKAIAQNNHGKVFDVENGIIKIWEPVRDVVDAYRRTVFENRL